MGKNANINFSQNFDIFAIKMTYLILLFSAIRSLLSELSLFVFPLLRKSKGYTLDSGLTPARSEKKSLEECQPPQFLRRIIVQG